MTEDTPTDQAAAVKTTTVKADGVTTTEIDGEEREVLRVPISSTRPDRENDRFNRDALEGMADQIRDQQPMVFDNHGMAGGFMGGIPYDARETIGTQFDAEVEDADDGEAELFALVNPDGTHPEGERLLAQVKEEKQAIKFSVGFGIKDEEPIEDEAGNEIGREFLAADLMETSRVGIPANPDASVTTATAKGGGAALPGYAMHPMFASVITDENGAAGNAYTAAKAYADGGDPDAGESDAVDDLRTEVAELRGVVEELREAVTTDAVKGSCDSDDDCPDGEVCVDGECVDADSVDDTSSADVPADADGLEDLRSEVEELREAVESGPAAPDSTDTTTEEPGLETEDADPDGSENAGPDDGADGHEYATTR